MGPVKIEEPKTPRSILDPDRCQHLLEKLFKEGTMGPRQGGILDDSPQVTEGKVAKPESQGYGWLLHWKVAGRISAPPPRPPWGPLLGGPPSSPTLHCALGEGPVPEPQQALYPLPSALTRAHCVLPVPLTAS